MTWKLRILTQNRYCRKRKFTDLILRHASGDFHVHKVIVCQQSKFFERACCGNFKVLEPFSGQCLCSKQHFQEASENNIEMKDITRNELERIVAALYGDEAEALNFEDCQYLQRLRVVVRMYLLADRYDIPHLRLASVTLFKSELDTTITIGIDTAVFPIIRELYQEENLFEPLRQIAAELLRWRRPTLLGFCELKAEFEKLIFDTPQFAADLLRVMLNTKLCSTCQLSREPRGKDGMLMFE